MKAILYGIGEYLNSHKHLLPENLEIIAYGDSSEEKSTRASGKMLDGKQIVSPSEIEKMEFDKLIICTDYGLSNRIYKILKEYDIPYDKFMFLCREEPVLFPFNTDGKWNYRILTDKSIESHFGDITICEKGGTDHDTVVEIFGENTYNIIILPETVVIDMGMNIGAASLYFAANKNVVRVYGFEPFPDTYGRACENIAMNPDWIRDKISTYNIAVTDKEGEQKVDVETENTGWRNIFSTGSTASSVQIKCRAAKDVVQEILDREEGERYVLKIDTEGSEFLIFSSLAETDIFHNIDAIVMEYHASPAPLIQVLEQYGFRYSIKGKGRIGVITAFKQ